MAKDAVKVDPRHYEVVVNNKRVRAVRVHYGPHEKSVMHGHPATLGIFLTDAHFRFTYPNGKSEEITTNAGDVMWFTPHEHLPENLSDQAFEAVIVELKAGASPRRVTKAKPAKARAARTRRARRR
ncbi:MAG: hypothetical protein ACRD88_09800 [Terriglobia bacterium]